MVRFLTKSSSQFKVIIEPSNNYCSISCIFWQFLSIQFFDGRKRKICYQSLAFSLVMSNYCFYRLIVIV